MLLPATDMGLIASHLSAHDGMIVKFKTYLKLVEDPALQKLITKQNSILRSHVSIMMEIMDPDKSEFSELPAMSNLQQEAGSTEQKGDRTPKLEKHVALETKVSAEAMAKDNFLSALKMKDPQVKKTHFEMALQQVDFLKEITAYLKEQNAEQTPLGTAEEQKKIMKYFQHVVEE